MMVNQAGDEIEEYALLAHGSVFETLTSNEIQEALALLCDKLNVKLIRTNATKHGNVELRLSDLGE